MTRPARAGRAVEASPAKRGAAPARRGAAPRPRRRRLRQWLLVYLGVVVVVGLLSGILWNELVTLPSYEVSDGFRASLQQTGWAEFAATDVVLTIIGLIAGAILGGCAWLFFRANGAWATLIAGLGGLLAGGICLAVGQFIGPRGFDDRIANADPGDLVRIDFGLHTWQPLVVWVGGAMIVLLIGTLIRRERGVNHLPQGGADEPVRPESGDTG